MMFPKRQQFLTAMMQLWMWAATIAQAFWSYLKVQAWGRPEEPGARFPRRIRCCIRAGRCRKARRPKRETRLKKLKKMLFQAMIWGVRLTPIVCLHEATIRVGWLPTNYYEPFANHVLPKTTAHSLLQRPLAATMGQRLFHSSSLATLG